MKQILKPYFFFPSLNCTGYIYEICFMFLPHPNLVDVKRPAIKKPMHCVHFFGTKVGRVEAIKTQWNMKPTYYVGFIVSVTIASSLIKDSASVLEKENSYLAYLIAYEGLKFLLSKFFCRYQPAFFCIFVSTMNKNWCKGLRLDRGGQHEALRRVQGHSHKGL